MKHNLRRSRLSTLRMRTEGSVTRPTSTKMQLLLLMLCLSTAHAQPCELSHVSFHWWEAVDMWLVGYNESPCSSNSAPSFFCQGSSWGDEEATVACREWGYKYGIGRHIVISLHSGHYRRIMCQGTENKLEECNIGDVTYRNCSSLGVVTQCSNVPQIYVTQLNYDLAFGHYLTTNEGQQSMQFCIEANGVLTEPSHIHVESQTTTNGHSPPAIAGYDYVPFTYTFELSSSEQCLEIEIINDPLPEQWEVFSVLLSTNSSAVNITTQTINIYIQPNDDDNECFEGNVTVVSDVNNSSLQLVEMCSSEGVWSPVCSDNLTLEDATDVCTKLGYQGLDLEGSVQSGGVAYKCQGNEVTLVDCAITSSTETSCYYALLKCMDTDNECSSIHMRCDDNRPTSTNFMKCYQFSTNNTPTSLVECRDLPNSIEHTYTKTPVITPSNTPDTNSRESSGGVSIAVVGGVIGATVVIIIGLIILLVIVLIVIVSQKKYKSSGVNSRDTEQDPHMEVNPVYGIHRSDVSKPQDTKEEREGTETPIDMKQNPVYDIHTTNVSPTTCRDYEAVN